MQPASTMSQTELLIDFVKENPIIYDYRHSNYKDSRAKDEKWKELATTLNTDYELLKRQWKNLKDSYSRHLKSRIGPIGQAALKYHHWQWAKHMEFFKPCLVFAQTNTNLEVNYSVNAAEGCEQQHHAQSTSSDVPDTVVSNQEAASTDGAVPLNISAIYNTDKRKKIQNMRRKTFGHQEGLSSIPKPMNNVDKVMSFLEKRETMDAVSHLFLSWSKTIKTFSPHRLLETKYQISNIIMQQERAQLEEDMANHQQVSQSVLLNKSPSASTSPLVMTVSPLIAYDCISPEGHTTTPVDSDEECTNSESHD